MSGVFLWRRGADPIARRAAYAIARFSIPAARVDADARPMRIATLELPALPR
jgi:hypothetical protein